MKKIIIKAFAKINLSIDILGLRADGFHEVSMVMQGVTLHDLVVLERATTGIELTCDANELSLDSANLAYRAAETMKKKYKLAEGLKIHLHKEIPIAAGLAGGSTDAAATLLGINELFGLNLSRAELAETAASLGSDVPFCLYPLTALAEGRGEIITDTNTCPPLWLVLFAPGFGVSTKDVYAHLHRVLVGQRPKLPEIIQALTRQDVKQLIKATNNVLEYATFDLFPQLHEHKEELMRLGAVRVLMSGSGPTLIAFMSDEASARSLSTAISKKGRTVYVCRTTCLEDMESRMQHMD